MYAFYAPFSVFCAREDLLVTRKLSVDNDVKIT